MRLLDYFTEDIAIDLGTANTLIYLKDRGIVLDQPSVVAVQDARFGGRYKNVDATVLAVGTEAREMLGRTPTSIRAIRPLKDGVIADFTVTELMLKHFIKEVRSRKLFVRPRIVISVPCQSTQVERRAIREAAMSAGAREVFLIEEPLAVAIGLNLPVAEPTGTMVVDIGGGTTEVGVISLGGLVWSATERVAGDLFNDEIRQHIAERYDILVGEQTAERVKHLIGSAWEGSKVLEMEIRGRDHRGAVCKRVITSAEIFRVLSNSITKIIQVVQRAMENSPPELTSDIWERGILLAGGGALLRDIDRRFVDDLGIPTIIAEDPLSCVARGCGRALEQAHLLEQVFARE